MLKFSGIAESYNSKFSFIYCQREGLRLGHFVCEVGEKKSQGTTSDMHFKMGNIELRSYIERS